jgi:hypothetical protein
MGYSGRATMTCSILSCWSCLWVKQLMIDSIKVLNRWLKLRTNIFFFVILIIQIPSFLRGDENNKTNRILKQVQKINKLQFSDKDFYQTWLRATRRVSSKKQELLTLREHMGSPSGFDGICVSHLFSILCFFVFLFLTFELFCVAQCCQRLLSYLKHVISA